MQIAAGEALSDMIRAEIQKAPNHLLSSVGSSFQLFEEWSAPDLEAERATGMVENETAHIDELKRRLRVARRYNQERSKIYLELVKGLEVD